MRMIKLQILLLFLTIQVTCSITTPMKNMEEASWSKVEMSFSCSSLTFLLFQAVSNYFSSQSLSSQVLGMIFPSLVPERRVDEKVSLDLNPEADWMEAISKTLARQSTYNNVISEALKGVTRIVGWLLLTLVRILKF